MGSTWIKTTEKKILVPRQDVNRSLYDIDFIGVFPLHSSYFSPDTVKKRKPVSPRRYRVCSFTTMVELDQRVIIPTSGLLTILTLPSNETRAPKAVD